MSIFKIHFSACDSVIFNTIFTALHCRQALRNIVIWREESSQVSSWGSESILAAQSASVVSYLPVGESHWLQQLWPDDTLDRWISAWYMYIYMLHSFCYFPLLVGLNPGRCQTLFVHREVLRLMQEDSLLECTHFR